MLFNMIALFFGGGGSPDGMVFGINRAIIAGASIYLAIPRLSLFGVSTIPT